ncbi:MAG: glutaminase A, partial [Pseudomonadota bacterium]
DRRATVDSIYRSLRNSGTGGVEVKSVTNALAREGLSVGDPRLKQTFKHLSKREGTLSPDDLLEVIAPEETTLIARALQGDLVIPEFFDFRNRLENTFEFCREFETGDVAAYIPQLARVNPDFYGLGVCTIDGQRFSLGDDDESYCVQSTCKPISYSIALDTIGPRTVHSHVGREPSGRSFNELTLNNAGLPHNPMINAGAIMCASLIRPHHPQADRFDYVMGVWKALAGRGSIGFDNSVYLSEKETADRNFALAYFMRENGAFPENTDIIKTLDFYFQCCSITLDVRKMAAVAATFANGGICPLTNQRVFQSETVKNCLSLMYSCGMYDFSGEYAFTVGIPAKSGVSGAMMLVVPGVCGIAIWSPRLDRLGNSVRGVEFSKRLVDLYAFHTYADLVADHTRIDPTRRNVDRGTDDAARFCAASARGDIGEMRRLIARGVDAAASDYDGRTGLHLAASEGAVAAVDFLLDIGCSPTAADRWGHTPIEDAEQAGHSAIVDKLKATVGQAQH